MTYLSVNILILAGPLLLLLLVKPGYPAFKRQRLLAILAAAIIFVIWDMWATAQGHWMFNINHIIGWNLLNLPIEEILFFFTAPFACWFIYDNVHKYFKPAKVEWGYWLSSLLVCAAFVFVAVNPDGYTLAVSLYLFVLLGLAFVADRQVFTDKQVWQTLLLSYIPFFLFNFFLTAIPVVIYSSEATTGLRVTTIPVEDFLYSFCLIFTNIVIYRWLTRRLGDRTLHP